MSLSFGIKLKEIRLRQKITQPEIAKALGVNKSAVSKWENNLLEPNIELIKSLATFLNVTIDELLDFNNYDYDFQYEHENTKLIHKEKKQKN